MPKKGRTGKPINFYFPDDIYQNLSLLSNLMGRSVSSILVMLAQDFIERNQEALNTALENKEKFSDIR